MLITWEEFKVAMRLLVSFGAVVALMLILGGSSYTVIGLLDAELDRAVNQTTKSVERIGVLGSSLANIQAAETGFILFSSMMWQLSIKSKRLYLVLFYFLREKRIMKVQRSTILY